MEGNKIEQVKIEIRSILLTFPDGASLEELLSTYKNFIGQRLPTRALGYFCDIDLLKSMPDAVEVSLDNWGHYHLFGVANEKTVHIQNLVKKQRKFKPSYKGKSSFYNATKSSAFMNPYDQLSPFKFPPLGLEDNQEICKTIQKHESVPANEELYRNVKIEVRSTLLAFHDEISLEEFLKSYKKFVGQRLPTQALGYVTEMDLLKSMPDVVQISTDKRGNYLLYGIADATTKHIQRLVSRQKQRKPVFKVKTRSFQFTRSSSFKDYSNWQSPFVSGALKSEITRLMNQYPKGIKLQALQLAYEKMFGKSIKNVNNMKDLEKVVSVIPGLKINNQKMVFCSCDSRNPFRVLDESGISEDEKFKFQKVLKENPDGILAHHFPEQYEKTTGEFFDLHTFGYVSILQLADALPDIFFRELSPGNTIQWKFYPAGSRKSSKHKEQAFHKVCSKNEISETKRKIENLLQLHERIDFQSFPVLYESTYQEKLPVCDTKLEEFLENLAKEIPIKLQVEEGIKSVYLVKKKLTYAEVNASGDQKTIPEDAVPLSFKYEKQEISETMVGNFIQIFISAILNPSEFWFQLLTMDGNKEELENLENELQSFYNGPLGNKYEIMVADIKIEAPCVAMCPDDQQWYRAIIKSKPELGFLYVESADYGMSERVERSKLRYLRHEYLKLPAQALKGKLARVRPLSDNSSWDDKTITRFIELCHSSSMAALIAPKENDVYSLYLYYNNGKEDLFVNLQLSKEGLVEIVRENSSIPGSHCKVLEAKSSEPASSSGVHKEEFTNEDEPPVIPKKLSEVQFKLHDSMQSIPFPTAGRCVKRLNISDDYKINIVVVKSKPYVSAGDLCSLLWSDKNEDFLSEQLKNDLVPTISITRGQEYEALFSQCLRLKVKGIKESEGMEYLKLYPLNHVVRILNIFGHPSAEVRNYISMEDFEFDPHARIWESIFDDEVTEDSETVGLNLDALGMYLLYDDLIVDDWLESEESDNVSRNSFLRLCTFDLKRLKESLHSTRLLLIAFEQKCGFSKDMEIKKIDHLIEMIEKRINYIQDSFC